MHTREWNENNAVLRARHDELARIRDAYRYNISVAEQEKKHAPERVEKTLKILDESKTRIEALEEECARLWNRQRDLEKVGKELKQKTRKKWRVRRRWLMSLLLCVPCNSEKPKDVYTLAVDTDSDEDGDVQKMITFPMTDNDGST